MVDRHVIIAAEGGLFEAAPSDTVKTGPSIIVTPLTGERFRRIKGHRDMHKLVAALRASEAQSQVA